VTRAAARDGQHSDGEEPAYRSMIIRQGRPGPHREHARPVPRVESPVDAECQALVSPERADVFDELLNLRAAQQVGEGGHVGGLPGGDRLSDLAVVHACLPV